MPFVDYFESISPPLEYFLVGKSFSLRETWDDSLFVANTGLEARFEVIVLRFRDWHGSARTCHGAVIDRTACPRQTAFTLATRVSIASNRDPISLILASSSLTSLQRIRALLLGFCGALLSSVFVVLSDSMPRVPSIMSNGGRTWLEGAVGGAAPLWSMEGFGFVYGTKQDAIIVGSRRFADIATRPFPCSKSARSIVGRLRVSPTI